MGRFPVKRTKVVAPNYSSPTFQPYLHRDSSPVICLHALKGYTATLAARLVLLAFVFGFVEVFFFLDFLDILDIFEFFFFLFLFFYFFFTLEFWIF